MTPEEAVLGACMLDENVIRFAVQHVMPSDFFYWQGEEIFSAIIALHSMGQPVDVVTVGAKLADSGSRVQAHELHRLIEQVPTAANVEFYAAEVRDAAVRRRLQAVASSLAQGAANEALEAGAVLAQGMEALKAVRDDAPLDARLETRTLGELMAAAKESRRYDWLIPGLFERGDRMMITGPPGKGKSTLMRQMSIFAAAGIHPFELRPIAPLRVLVIDRENSWAQWTRKSEVMFAQAHALGRGDLVKQLVLHCQPKEMDLARDRDLGMVHRVMDDEGPFDLVQIGPLYKLAPRAIQTDDEAAPITAALDSIRERGACLLIEAHAVKDKNGSLAPRGSAALTGWPEFGRGLSQDLANPQKWWLEEWRGDRDERDIPAALLKGGPVPWMVEGLSEELLQRFRTYNEPERLAF
jgi:DnaB-like helicase N terminal domain/AAA domain